MHVAALLLGTAASAAVANPPDFMPRGAEAQAPRGFVEMCARDATFCGAPDGSGSAPGEIATAAIVRQPAAQWRKGGGLPALLPWPSPDVGHGVPAVSIGLPPPGHAIPWAWPSAFRWQSAGTMDISVLFAAGIPRKPAGGVFHPASFAMVSPVAASFSPPAAPTGEDGKPAPMPGPASGRDVAMLLDRVNHHVNGHVSQVTDEQRFGRNELWERSGTGRGAMGDCEDIAIEKRYELIARGFPADRLAFAVAYLRGIGLHAVLIARTARGDMVLDSRTPHVLVWSRTGYAWVTIQSMDRPMAWHGLGSPGPGRFVRADQAAAGPGQATGALTAAAAVRP